MDVSRLLKIELKLLTIIIQTKCFNQYSDTLNQVRNYWSTEGVRVIWNLEYHFVKTVARD